MDVFKRKNKLQGTSFYWFGKTLKYSLTKVFCPSLKYLSNWNL